MAGKGLYTYSLQEAENIDLGQCGSIFTNTASTITPPSGMVIVAIQSLAPVTFSAMVSENNETHINSSQGSNSNGATGGIVYTTGYSGPTGSILYGRWTSLTVSYSESARGIICYLGK